MCSSSAVTCDGFVQRVNNLVAEEKYVSARQLVQRYPDVALDLLRGTERLAIKLTPQERKRAA